MALTPVVESTKLIMHNDHGVDPTTGKSITKNATYSKIITGAEDSAVYALALGIDQLQNPTCDAVYKDVRTALMDA